MAQEIVINVKLEASGVVDNINKIETELAKLNQERDNLLQSGLSPAALTSALNAVDSEISKLDGTFQKLTQSTNSYKIAQEENAKSQERAAAAAKRLETINRTAEGITKGLAGSVNLATSAFAIFGAENEEVAETLKKVQAAAGFATGIKDLTESFKALNLGGLALNKTLLANPFVLIGTLVVTLIGAFGGFEVIIKAVTNVVQLAFAPLTALFSAFQSGKKEVDDINVAFERYEKNLNNINVALTERERQLGNDIALLKAQGASTEDIAKKERELNIARKESATDLIRLSKKELQDFLETQIIVSQANDEQIRLAIEREIKNRTKNITNLKEREDEEKELKKETDKFLADLAAARIKKNQAEADEKVRVAQAETDKKTKSNNDYIKAVQDGERDKAKAEADAKTLRDKTIIEIQNRLKAEEDAVRASNAIILDERKKLLIEQLKAAEDVGASPEQLQAIQEQFDADRIALDIKTNNQLIENRKQFQVTEKELEIVKADEKKKIDTQIAAQVLDLQRKNTEIELVNLKKASADRVKNEQEEAKDKLNTIEIDFLLKKQELQDRAATDEEFRKEGYDNAIRQLEIDKQKSILTTLEVGSKEYLAKVAEINDAEIKLADDTNKKIIADREEQQKKLLELVQTSVDGIASIVQDVSPLFESVGQTALQSLENISGQIPGLLAKIQDESLSTNEKIIAGLQVAAGAIGELNAIFQKNSEERIEDIDNEEQARIASLEKQKQAGLITEEQLAAGRTAIEGEAAKKRREAQKKAFQQEKAIRITQAVLQTAAAVLNAFSSGAATPLVGPAVGSIFAGIAAAFGAVQIGLIASQKFPDEGGSTGGSAPSVPSVPTQQAQGSITPQTFQPNTFGTGVSQEGTFGQSGNANVGGNVLRAYVVESDIASTSNRLNTIRQTSEL